MPTKHYLRKRLYNKGSNCHRKSQLSEILTEPLYPRGTSVYPRGTSVYPRGTSVYARNI